MMKKMAGKIVACVLLAAVCVGVTACGGDSKEKVSETFEALYGAAGSFVTDFQSAFSNVTTPDEFDEVISSKISECEKVIQEIEKVDTGGDSDANSLRDGFKGLIEVINSFLGDMRTAVADKNTDKISELQTDYQKNIQEKLDELENLRKSLEEKYDITLNAN